MQKFIVTREEIAKWFNTLPSKDLGWIIPETAILEGELLEGGTVECPNGCDHYASTKCWCPCHDKKKLSDFPDEISAREYFKEPPFNRNKKEEIKKHYDGSVCDCQFYGHECTHKDFNRETPKIEELELDPYDLTQNNLGRIKNKLNEVIRATNTYE